MENPYHILGVSPTATTDEIRKAYRSLAMRHHPDRSAHPDSEIRFNAIKTAYELLSDTERRAEYNRSLSNRIIVDCETEARALWHSLFDRCGVLMPGESR